MLDASGVGGISLPGCMLHLHLFCRQLSHQLFSARCYLNLYRFLHQPPPRGVPGNEDADRMAKLGAVDCTAGSPQSHLMANVASRAILKRRAAENKSREASTWWTPSIERSRGYLARKTPGFRPELRYVRKVLASRYYQLMMGHAVIAPYLKYKIKTSDSDTC
jgi:hypothetical protein